MEAIILFHSTNYAIWAQNLLKENSIECKMIPVPRDLSSDCGYCVRTSPEDVEQAEKLLEENDVEYDRVVVR
jgi:ferredoxin